MVGTVGSRRWVRLEQLAGFQKVIDEWMQQREIREDKMHANNDASSKLSQALIMHFWNSVEQD